MRAARQFLQWTQENHGPCSCKEDRVLKQGRIPYGWFSEYVRAHTELHRHCCVYGKVKKGNSSYVRILRFYRAAARNFVAKEFEVAEGKARSSSDAAVAAGRGTHPDPFAKFRNKKERTGRQYFNSSATFQRDSKRRRGMGGGRRRSCAMLREASAV